MNKRGQALVEFIIIMPVLLLIILAVFDVANIYKKRIELEDSIDNVIMDENFRLPDDITKEERTSEGKITYRLTSKISITSPFLKPILEDPYNVIVERTINE